MNFLFSENSFIHEPVPMNNSRYVTYFYFVFFIGNVFHAFLFFLGGGGGMGMGVGY